SCNQNLAIGQQGGAVIRARRVEAPRRCPGPDGWIVEFCTRDSSTYTIRSACDEHLAVRQQGSGVIRAGDIEAARGIERKWGIATLRNPRQAKPRYQNKNDEHRILLRGGVRISAKKNPTHSCDTAKLSQHCNNRKVTWLSLL